MCDKMKLFTGFEATVGKLHYSLQSFFICIWGIICFLKSSDMWNIKKVYLKNGLVKVSFN